jgi:exosortase/archaeosortase family protein
VTIIGKDKKKIAPERLKKGLPFRFLAIFICLFLAFYYGNIAFFSLTSHGKNYNSFVDEHLNYISGLRHLLLGATRFLINLTGLTCLSNDYRLLVAGRGSITLIYSCLGLGVMSFFVAFVIAYPKNLKSKLIFLVTGLICIQALNILRFVLLALFWDKKSSMILDHHTIFNIAIYIIIAISLYFWVKHEDKPLAGGKN